MSVPSRQNVDKCIRGAGSLQDHFMATRQFVERVKTID